MNIADIRKSYEKAELNEDASHADPLQQFDQWLTEAIAAEVPEPNAMTVATVASNLRPSTRVVLIKGYDARGIVWYTNYESQQGPGAGGQPLCRAAVSLGGAGARGAHRGPGGKSQRRRERRLLRQPPARFAHRRLGQPAEPGHPRPHACWSRRRRNTAPDSCCTRRARRTGAATASSPTPGSSGRAARAACTTGCVTGWRRTEAGRASGWRPDQPGSFGNTAITRLTLTSASAVETATLAVTRSSALR